MLCVKKAGRGRRGLDEYGRADSRRYSYVAMWFRR